MARIKNKSPKLKFSCHFPAAHSNSNWTEWSTMQEVIVSIRKWLSLKQGTGNGGTGNGERGTGNGESLKGGISKRGNL